MSIWHTSITLLLLAASTVALSTSSTGHVRLSSGHKLWYKVARPELLDAAASPLVVLHGGPQVPSDYLFDLERLDDRAVVFYDQLGCGRSDEAAADSGCYSVDASVQDLRAVLRGVGLDERPYHLYGQSWGGLLAFFHLATVDADETPCGSASSLVLSNTPSSVALVETEAGRLLEACDGDIEAFMAAHNYRGGAEQPPQLADAYAHAGTTWRGSGAIKGVEATAETMRRVECAALVMRGEHDFCTEACVEAWSGLPDARFVTLAGASHHALLETPEEYLEALGGFLRTHD